MPFAHPNLPHARQPPYSGGVAAVGADHMWYTPSSGQPDHVTRVVTSRRNGKATIHTTPATRPNPTRVTTSTAVETGERRQPGARPVFIRPSRRHFFPHVKHETFERLQDEVVLKRSMHAPTNQPIGATLLFYQVEP